MRFRKSPNLGTYLKLTCSRLANSLQVPSTEANTPKFMKALAYLDDVEDELPNCQMLAPNELRLGDLTPSVISRYVVWSPTGLADNYEYVLKKRRLEFDFT